MKPCGATIGDAGVGVDDAEHAAEVVDVGVGVDHRGDRPVAAVLAVQRQRGGGATLRRSAGRSRSRRCRPRRASCSTGRGHGPGRCPSVTSNRPVVRRQLALPPQARVHRVRAVPASCARTRRRRCHHARRPSARDHGGLEPGEEAAVRVVEVGSVVKICGHRGPPGCRATGGVASRSPTHPSNVTSVTPGLTLSG